MSEQRAVNVGPSRIEIAYESFGDERAPPLLLIMGLAAQMLHWHEELCAALAARGLRVIRFDNRDAGLSTHFTSAPTPDFAAAMRGDTSSAVYTLSDMAADAVGLLDALGIASAHLVGASMGGAIAQTIAIEQRDRVRSLTSMMSTTGDLRVGQVTPEGMKAFSGAPAKTREQVIERSLNASRIAGSPAFPDDEAELRARAGRLYDRDHDDVAIVRQAVASLASGDRTPQLHALRVPALVIHGDADVICNPTGGRATAAAIPDATLVMIDGMGHGMPRALWPRLTDLVATHVTRAEDARR